MSVEPPSSTPTGWFLLPTAFSMHFSYLLILMVPLLELFHLQEGKVGFNENKVCNMLYEQRVGKGKNYSVHEEMLCAGDFLTGKAICQVCETISVLPLPHSRETTIFTSNILDYEFSCDSGGPLVCDLTNAWVLVGLASWGLDCKYTIYPSDFTSVSYFIDWINEIQKLTSLPDAMSAPPQTQFPYQPLQAAAHLGLTQAL
ncbi:putative serine protease 47 [Camelus dromedarius]|uniref:Putative serine protease 47 n=1 Tax=Camelus dromedarius TaxID=9838 RepID=A0A5N4DJJ5_CAMDR|nr:putative serine protease 47 [Camelus dromedarius]